MADSNGTKMKVEIILDGQDNGAHVLINGRMLTVSKLKLQPLTYYLTGMGQERASTTLAGLFATNLFPLLCNILNGIGAVEKEMDGPVEDVWVKLDEQALGAFYRSYFNQGEGE